MLTRLFSIFFAGGLGALTRFGLTTYFTSVFGKGTPWGVAIVNLLGCFGFGLIAALFDVHARWDAQIKTAILTGFFGAFTTFSTYIFELRALMKNGELGRACGDFLLQNVLGLAFVALGFWIVKHC